MNETFDFDHMALCADCYRTFPEGTLERFEGDWVCPRCIRERNEQQDASTLRQSVSEEAQAVLNFIPSRRL